VEVYDLELEEWLDYPDTKRQREGATAIVVRNNLLLIGGSDQGERALETVERFNFEDDRWEEISEWKLDRPRVSSAAAVWNDAVFIFGGFNTFGPVGQVQEYNSTSGSVSSTDMPLARGALGASAVGDAIYVIGGRSQDRVLDLTQVFYPRDARWDTAASLNAARYGFGTATVGRSIYILGGIGDQNVPLDSVEKLGPIGTATEDVGLPPDLTLETPFPNPFGQKTQFEYSVSLSQSRHVTIRVFDVMGRVVRTLVNEAQSPGPHQVVWAGDTDAGARVADGLYIIRMSQGPFSIIRKAVRVGG
jgi:hypothetical protein